MMVTTALPLATLLLLLAAAVVSAESQGANVTVTSTPYPIAADITSVKSERCPNWMELRGDKCYFFSNGKNKGVKTAAEAKDMCGRVFGGTLAMVKNRHDQKFLSSKLTESSWLGLFQKEYFAPWRWADNDVLLQPRYWRRGEPRGDGYCAEMRKDWGYLWDDIPCNEKRSFICEIDAKPFCPPGWRHHEEGGMCYYFPHDHFSKPYKRFHHEAEILCKYIGDEPQLDKAHLVHVKTDSTYEFLKQQLWDDHEIWIGLKRDGNTWKWSDGSPLKQGSSNKFWDVSEPRGDGDCVEARKLSDRRSRPWSWNDVSCQDELNYFVCQTEAKKFHSQSSDGDDSEEFDW